MADDQIAATELRRINGVGIDHIDLQLYGLFGAYASDAWKVTATVYVARTELHYTIGPSAEDSFGFGYIQAERHFGRNFTGFVRYEEAAGVGNSPYLHLFEQFARERYLGGVRWDFVDRQALTLQVTDSFFINGHFSDVRLQWSAALF